MRSTHVLVIPALVGVALAAPLDLRTLRVARAEFQEALERGVAPAAALLRRLPGPAQSDLIRRLARQDPSPPAGVAAVAASYGALSTPARHAALPLLGASGGPEEAARVAPFLGSLPERPGLVRLQSRTFQAVVTMWLRGPPDAARPGLERLASDPSLPAGLRRIARETAWSLGQVRDSGR